ncbi:AMP-dependent synthetase and ligase [Chloroherpeton thalassium ATCC 35110]|uniref:AMP-dependent synthetase and ligase n=1 Tax=Chloroherpeton thalassium (strain ATCC 35110 / GB-78) TaxID=517418 RepID=B3QW49_CHLT3|nr:long-chain fatty acid--CoA ligase [Chloroherpeton thalassium]ACF14703.1 AMP-dependent synthetase and ligase [Chloroherpeton thalassium ATCC 35110]
MNSPVRLFDLLEYQLKHFPKEDALAYKVDGIWNKFSTQKFAEMAGEVALGLDQLGVRKGDMIANITENNRPEWNFLDMGMMSIGAVHVPLYANLTKDDYAFILSDSGAKFIFVSSASLYETISSIAPSIPSLERIYTYDFIEEANHWHEITTLGKSVANPNERLASLKSRVSESDLAMLIYTSGTTGTPKGVCLTHKNLMANALAGAARMKSNPTERAISFLPLCHSFERIINCMYIYQGCSIYYAQSLQTVADDMKEVRPHVFATVPRMLEKVYDKILSKGNELTGIKYMLFKWSLGVGFKYDPSKASSLWYAIQYRLADKLVFPKWREAFGGSVRAVVSGGAALQPRLAKLFFAAGIPIYEGYGLSETAPVISVNYPETGGFKIGTVGTVIEGGEVRIAGDGEILYKGPNVMQGYHNREDLTQEVIDSDGWFHTGDIGEFDGPFLMITDRKKELFKTSGGKYIAPQVIENKMKESRFIEQIMVIGEGRKFPAALIVPNFLYLKAYCEHKGIHYTTNEEILMNPLIQQKFEAHVQKYNEPFAQYMKIKKFIVLDHEWTAETGELSPKLSLRRKVILHRYHEQIERLYQNETLTTQKITA